jgi:hypothetical protein
MKGTELGHDKSPTKKLCLQNLLNRAYAAWGLFIKLFIII